MKLDGIRVLDLSQFLPGPHFTMMMADHGADVIRVESPVGEPTRQLGLRQAGESVWFRNTHRNKRSVVMNLKKPDAVEAFLRLAKTCDVIVESFRPGVVNRLGIGYDAVNAVHPGIVYCSIAAFGQTGPLVTKPAHDLSIQAETGLVSLNLGPDDQPALPSIPAADMAGSLMAMNGILMALLRRHQTGQGDYIDISMQDSLASWLVNVVGPVFAEDRAPEPKQERSFGGNAMYNIYECADGHYLTLGGSEVKFAINLFTALGKPELAEHCKSPPGAGQAPARDFLKKTFLAKDLSHWCEFLSGIDVCWAPVRTLHEALNSEQIQARNMRLEFPDNGSDEESITQLGIPIQYRNEPGRVNPEVPAMGEHTTQVLLEAGINDDEISRLLSEEAVIQARIT
ncbi:MAG: CoA transferase [Granulosicoccus sp.]|nr:CoA transferase [Granulosicoccus sp.]